MTDKTSAGSSKEWVYCPECGSDEIHYEEGRHKQCAECHQEWFSDIDYTNVVRANLNDMKKRLAPETNAWQPIDTAPQSGKWVLLWWPRVTDAAMIGYRVSGEWRTAPGGDAWAGFDGPTHWQPSPAGPALKASERCNCADSSAGECPVHR